MEKKKGHLIAAIEPGSIAQEMELEAGDYVMAVNGQELEDVFDYQFLIDDTYIELTVQKANGEEWLLEIDKEYEEDLGITFQSSLMSEYRSCTNKCIFCFIDQMPPGMRETLYFKDDDSRLSFLQGNYVTLTNMKDKDIDRIIRYKLAPINISVHTTNPQLRCQMLHNRFAGTALEKIKKLYDAGIEMNGQIVLCKGINDGEELERTISDLSRYLPYMESLSVVPVGLTKYRDGLYPLEAFQKEDAEAALAIIERWQKRLYQRYGTHFVQASDEFYILAEREIPPAEQYDGYIQLENGVGMVRLLLDECREALEDLTSMEVSKDTSMDVSLEKREISLATGKLAAPFLKKICADIEKRYPHVHVNIYTIVNHFFGEEITVAGLITGQDLVEQLKGRKLGSELLLSSVMFRSGEEVFLDDMTRDDAQIALQVPINIVKSSGQDFVRAVLGLKEEHKEDMEKEKEKNHQPYELEELI